MPRYSPYQGAAGSDYQGLRQVLAPPYRNWEAGDIEALFENYNAFNSNNVGCRF